METIGSLVRRIRLNPADPELERDIAALAVASGEWVRDAIVDALTAGDPGTYDQGLQDRLRRRTAAVEIVAGRAGELEGRLPVAQLQPDAVATGIVSVLTALVPADFYRIPHEAGMNALERNVWLWWIDGRTVREMHGLVTKPSGEPYSIWAIWSALRRGRLKAWTCPSLGWRTCLAEDLARGRALRKPNYVWIDVTRLRSL